MNGDLSFLEQGPLREAIPVSRQTEAKDLASFLFTRLQYAPAGPVIDLSAIGPLAVGAAVSGVIEVNSRLARAGRYVTMVPTTRKVDRSGDDSQYTTSVATILVLIVHCMGER